MTLMSAGEMISKGMSFRYNGHKVPRCQVTINSYLNHIMPYYHISTV